LIECSRVEFADTGIECISGRLDVEKSRFKEMSHAGVIAANECRANVIENTFSHCAISVRAEGKSKALIQHNLVYEYKKNAMGIGININSSEATLADNIIVLVDIGVKTEYITGTSMVHNYVTNCSIGISTINAGPIIEKNTISNCLQATIYINSWPIPAIVKNNILASDYQKAVWAVGKPENDINASNNFWGTQNIEVAKRKIFDLRVDNNGNKTTFKINIDPIALQLYDDAKPR